MGGELELTVVERINAEHYACERAARTALKHAIRCGELLEEQKAKIPHGEWGAWLRENFDGANRSAQVYMRLSRNREAVEEAAKAQTSAHLSIDGALRVLASPREPDALPAPPAEAASEDQYALRKANTRASNYKAERDRQQALLGARQEERQEILSRIESEFAAEMAALKVKYGDVEEPRFAHLPPEHWARKLREAKSQRVMNVARHLYQMSGWADWMGGYFPDEAAEAIEDMDGKEDVINAWHYIIWWMEEVSDELEERGLKGEGE